MSNSQLQQSLPKIGLGTVEIGVADYAIGQKGLVSEADAIKLLKEAVEIGVTYIDTARAYGLAEERIGKSGILEQPNVIVGTKCAQFLEKGGDPRGQELEQRIRDDIETSLKALQTESLPLVQLHGGTKEQIERGELIEVMTKLTQEGKVQHVGIATRSEEASLTAIQSGFFESVQVAYSILDQRMAPEVLPAAESSNVAVINRSVMLKGVLTRNYPNLPDALTPLKTSADKANAIAEELGTILPALALRFVLSNPSISTALVGTSKIERLKAARDAAALEPLPQDVLEQLQQLAVNDPEQVDPARWPKETQTI